MKENPNNRNLLIKLFGEKWVKERDERMKKLICSKPKEEQLKLFI